MEIVLATFIGGVMSIIGVMLLNRNWYKRKEMEYKYNIKRFKLGKRYKLQERDLPKKSEPNWLEIIGKLDKSQIGNLVDMIPEDVDDEGDILGSIIQYAQNNPELVQNLLGGLMGKPKEQKTLTDEKY